MWLVVTITAETLVLPAIYFCPPDAGLFWLKSEINRVAC